MARHAAGHGRHEKKRSWGNWLHSNRFRGRPRILTSKYWYGI